MNKFFIYIYLVISTALIHLSCHNYQIVSNLQHDHYNVFVTSSVTQGDMLFMGGHTTCMTSDNNTPEKKADCVCNELADGNPDLPRTAGSKFKAYLNYSGLFGYCHIAGFPTDTLSTFNQSCIFEKDMDGENELKYSQLIGWQNNGQQIFYSWFDIYAQHDPSNSITIDSSGNSYSGNVWTGSIENQSNCKNWTTNSPLEPGISGNNQSVQYWRNSQTQTTCNTALPIYCFELPPDPDATAAP